MLKLGDFIHLPQVDTLFEQLIADAPGLMIVAGSDPRATPGGGFLPSGHATIFRLLMREIWAAQPASRGLIVAEGGESIRIPREFRQQVELLPVQPPFTYISRIVEAARRRPHLLVVERLSPENLPAVLEAAQGGQRILTQLDTVFRGADAARYLLDMGAALEQLRPLTWIITVQRLSALCPQCKQPAALLSHHLARLRARYPALDERLAASESKPSAFFRAGACARCDQSGRFGDVMVLDIFRAAHAPDTADLFEQASLLPAEEYVLDMALQGYLSLQDVLHFESDQVRRTYSLFVTQERALSQANATLERKVVELESAYHVLQQRTQALFSLEALGQALITSSSLDDLAAQVCRHARDLCGADRAILYYQRAEGQTEVLAVGGWDPALTHQTVDTEAVFGASTSAEPTPYNRLPPAVKPEVKYSGLRAGLYVPLIAQDRRVGVMIVHSAKKAHFAPGEVALIQTFANQAALAIQRAGLIEQLQAKITQLEAAQAELARKERMERELELARHVQQSMLPRTFPEVTGYQFAARNEPARQVGGDFYDVIPLDDGYFGVAIADVSDKGMPAALYMALTRSLLRAEARRALCPSDVLTRVNELLLELGEPNMFVTVFYGVVERATRHLIYTRAGHDHPFLLRAGAALELGGRGAALGLFDNDLFRVSEEHLDLAPGDRLVLYTDGLTDVMDPDGQLFSHERLKVLLENHAEQNPVNLCEGVFGDLAAYQGTADQFDDSTMLVVAVE
jgi:serine phosphatase RsbU (regulator of sigma subunit)